MDIEIFENILEIEIWSNTVSEYLVSLAVLFLCLLIFLFFRERLLNKLELLSKKTATDIDETAIKIIRGLKPPFYFFISIYVALLFINIHEILNQLINYVLIIWFSYQVVVAATILIDYIVKEKLSREKEPHAQSALALLAKIMKAIVWTALVLFVLSNLGINITSFVATLGIGGVAVAFALQGILSDLFSSFAIYFDKPFVVGDFILVGEQMGVVEKIGIKTTRIRALQGEEIVISNQELTTARIQNFKKMHERRIVFKFGLTYSSSVENIKLLNERIKEIITDIKNAKFDRSHFYSFGDSSLNFETVYYLQSPDYNIYMNTQQEINLKIKEAVEEIGLSFAFPTRVVYVSK